MKNNSIFIPLFDRSIISISGSDAKKFLQGLTTNDINKISKDKSIYTLMLTPQGKYLFEFFISFYKGEYFLDCNKERKDELIKRLSMYKLRADVVINDFGDKYEVCALIGGNVFSKDGVAKIEGETKEFCKGLVYTDPRSINMFARSIIEKNNNYQSFEAKEFSKGKISEYETLRINNILAEGDKDMTSNSSYPLQFAMDRFNAINFEKGCYVGQEVTTRTKHRGTLRKTIYKIESEIELAEKHTSIEINGKHIGKICSHYGNIGLALIEIEKAENAKSETTEITAKSRKITIC